jgi:4-nitrophenyl phosphatase
VALATNNATRSVDQFVEKLRGFGVSLDSRLVINSAEAAAEYLRKKHPAGGPVFIVGEEGLQHALAYHGFFHSQQDPHAVVVALDRTLTYEKLNLASQFIRSGVDFIGANPDNTLPTPEGMIPGSGSILAFLEAASGRAPTIIGKPQPAMVQIILERLGTSPENTLVVGDRLETDIAGGQAAGCPTALVLSGVTSEEMARLYPDPPTYISADLGSLVNSLIETGGP